LNDVPHKLLFRNAVLNLLGRVIPLILAVIAIPFIIQGLGKERFAILSLAWAIVSSISVIDLGLGRATTKFVAEAIGKGEEYRIPELVWTSLCFQVVIGFVGAIVAASLSPFLIDRAFNISPDMRAEALATFYIIASLIPVVMTSAALSGVLEAYQRYDLINSVNVPSNIFNFIVPIMAIFWDLKLPFIVFLLLIVKIITALVFLFLCSRVNQNLKPGFSISIDCARPLFSYGKWIALSNAIWPLLLYVDRFILGSLISMTAVAFYTAPFEMVTRLWIIPASLVSLFPVFSMVGSAREGDIIKLYARAVKFVLFIMGPLTLIIVFFADDILRIWLGSEFEFHSSLVLKFLALGVLAVSYASIADILTKGIGRPDITAKFHLFELVPYIGLVWMLVKKFGIAGAAAAWSIRAVVDAGLMFWASSKIFPSTLPVFLQARILRVVLIIFVFAGTLFLMTVVKNVFLFVMLMVVIFGIFFWSSWYYAFDELERKLLKEIVGY